MGLIKRALSDHVEVDFSLRGDVEEIFRSGPDELRRIAAERIDKFGRKYSTECDQAERNVKLSAAGAGVCCAATLVLLAAAAEPVAIFVTTFGVGLFLYDVILQRDRRYKSMAAAIAAAVTLAEVVEAGRDGGYLQGERRLHALKFLEEFRKVKAKA